MNDRKKRQSWRPRYVLQVDKLNNQPVSNTYLLDITPHGAKLETDISLIEGCQVNFAIRPPATALEAEKTAVFQGQSVWIKKIKDDPIIYRIGITFPAPYGLAVYKILEKFSWKFFT